MFYGANVYSQQQHVHDALIYLLGTLWKRCIWSAIIVQVKFMVAYWHLDAMHHVEHGTMRAIFSLEEWPIYKYMYIYTKIFKH